MADTLLALVPRMELATVTATPLPPTQLCKSALRFCVSLLCFAVMLSSKIYAARLFLQDIIVGFPVSSCAFVCRCYGVGPLHMSVIHFVDQFSIAELAAGRDGGGVERNC